MLSTRKYPPAASESGTVSEARNAFFLPGPRLIGVDKVTFGDGIARRRTFATAEVRSPAGPHQAHFRRFCTVSRMVIFFPAFTERGIAAALSLTRSKNAGAITPVVEDGASGRRRGPAPLTLRDQIIRSIQTGRKCLELDGHVERFSRA